PLEHGLAVVEDRRRRIEADRRVGHDARLVPLLPRLPVHDEHVVAEVLAEAERGLGRARPRLLRELDGDLAHGCSAHGRLDLSTDFRMVDYRPLSRVVKMSRRSFLVGAGAGAAVAAGGLWLVVRGRPRRWGRPVARAQPFA